MIEYIFGIIVGILLGAWFGWMIAKKKMKMREKKLLLNCPITEEQIKAERLNDEVFYKMKKEVNDGRKSRYKTVKRQSTCPEPIRGESDTTRESEPVRSNTSSPEREPVQVNDVEQSEQTDTTVELDRPTNL